MRDLVELRKEAEKAVDGMPEGELKGRAFETILAHLLSTASNDSPRSPSIKAPSGKQAAGGRRPTSATDRILFLKSEGFFDTQRSIGEIRAELKNNGWHYPVTSLSGRLQSLVQTRQLRRERVDGVWKYSKP